MLCEVSAKDNYSELDIAVHALVNCWLRSACTIVSCGYQCSAKVCLPIYGIRTLSEYIIPMLQAFDLERNFVPFIVTIEIVLINDNVLTFMLDGTGGNVNYTTEFAEGQNYPGFSGTIPVRLSDGLVIRDNDVGPKFLNRVQVSLIGGRYIC